MFPSSHLTPTFSIPITACSARNLRHADHCGSPSKGASYTTNTLAGVIVAKAAALAAKGQGRQLRCRTLMRRAASSVPSSAADLKALRLRELRRTLEVAGLDVAGRFDRESLMELLDAEGVVERVLASAAAAAEAAKPQVLEVPIKVVETSIFVDLTLGSTQARFMLDLSSPFNMVDNVFAKAQNAVPAPGQAGTGPTPRMTLGRTFWGPLEYGELLAVPVEMKMPPGCQGLLSLEFLRTLDLELDVAFESARAAVVKDASSALPFDVGSLRQIPLQVYHSSVQGYPLQLLSAPLLIRRPGPLNSQAASCTAIFDLANISGCSESAIEQLGLSEKELSPGTLEIRTPSGASQVLKQAELSLVIGAKESQVIADARLCIGHPALQRLGFAPEVPAAIVGIDLLQRAPFVISHRLASLWMRS